jgi:aspartyl-tRNA(Asn)/glutamyl-tRNA(Gln) amidotransferase subunit A
MFYDPARETSSGSAIRAGFHADTVATVASRVQAAGGVNLGALNMTEFALGPTGHNAVYGACRNPWNTDYIPGGSSSGAAAAVAARLAYGTLGSDTGGSIRGPASANGVLGLKPTYGRVPRSGAMPLSWSCDHIGPLARTAADLARLLGVIAGHDPADPGCSRRAVPDYEAGLEAGVAGLRIGVPRDFFFEAVDGVVQRRLDEALATLVSAGATLVPIDVPDPSGLTELSRAIVYPEAAAAHAHWLRTRPQDYSPQVHARIASGVAIPAALYLEALQLRPRLLARFVEPVYARCDVLATPTLAEPVPTLAATDVGGGETMWTLIAALVRCVAPFNYLGLPALSVPVGPDGNGLPVGLQLVGRPFAEALLLRVAAAYQRHSDWHEHRPALAAA